jgi:hypothetical protein
LKRGTLTLYLYPMKLENEEKPCVVRAYLVHTWAAHQQASNHLFDRVCTVRLTPAIAISKWTTESQSR